MSTRTIEVEGLPTRIRVEGDPTAPPVVLLHGITRSLDDWALQFPLLSTDHRVISLDMHGFGHSARRPEPASLTALARGVVATLDALDEKRPVHVMGNSLGGATSLHLQSLAPERVASVTLVNSAGFGSEVTYLLRMLAIPRLGEAILKKPNRVGLKHIERNLYRDPKLATKERVANALTMARLPGAAEFMAELLPTLGTFRGVQAPWREQMVAAVAAHQRPTLIVWGENDRILPAHHAEAARKAFPHARLHMFANTGHCPMIERPEAFATLAREFVASTKAGSVGG